MSDGKENSTQNKPQILPLGLEEGEIQDSSPSWSLAEIWVPTEGLYDCQSLQLHPYLTSALWLSLWWGRMSLTHFTNGLVWS
jgi:hypothetical protein